MTTPWIKRRGNRERLVVALGEAQGWLCPICGEVMFEPPTVDHVWPRLGKQGRTGLYRNALATHYWCNNAKGDRKPTGCELIWLIAVNARLAEHPHPREWAASPPPTLAALWPVR